MFSRAPAFVVAASLALASLRIAEASIKVEMPKTPTRDLKASFPDCPNANAPLTLRALRVCRGDLEAFRTGVLEPYNKSVHAYSAKLTALDAKLRKDASIGKISWTSYEEQKARINEELQRATPDGDLMEPYFEFVAKYKQRSRYVEGEIQRCVTDPRQSCR